MKAVAYRTAGPIDREYALQDITLDTPKAEGRGSARQDQCRVGKFRGHKTAHG